MVITSTLGDASADKSVGLVHIVDDDISVRASLIRLLRSDGIEAVSHCNAKELNEALSDDRPTCIVLDVRLVGENGLDIQDSLRERGCNAPILFLTGYGTIPMTVRALQAGAVEFFTKPIDGSVLLAAIRKALAVDAAAYVDQRSLMLLRGRFESLTEREQQVMRCAIGGLMNKQTAAELGITEITAKVHKRRVMQKMEAATLPALVRMAERLGLSASRMR